MFNAKGLPLISSLNINLLNFGISSKDSFLEVSSIIAPNSSSWQFSGSSPLVSMSMLIYLMISRF